MIKLNSRSYKQGQNVKNYTLLVFFINLPCLFAYHNSGNSVSVYPEHDIYLNPHQPLEMLCTTNDGTSEDLQFRNDRGNLDSEVVNATTRRLYMENIKKPKGKKRYSCAHKKTGEFTSVDLAVGSPPGNKTNFHCTFPDDEKKQLNCYWEAPAPTFAYQVVSYTVKVQVDGRTVEPCQVKLPTKTAYRNRSRSCAWSGTQEPIFKTQPQYLFILIGCNPFGCSHQNITVDYSSITVAPRRN